MCWVLVMMLLSSLLVGWLAQSWKKRTGALWGLIALLVEVGAALVLYAALFAARPRLLRLRPLAAGRLMLWGAVVALGVGVIMALVVATLPMLGRGGGEEP